MTRVRSLRQRRESVPTASRPLRQSIDDSETCEVPTDLCMRLRAAAIDANNGQHYEEKSSSGCTRLVHHSAASPGLLSKVAPFSDPLVGSWRFGVDKHATFRIEERDCRLFMVQGSHAGQLRFLGKELFEAGLKHGDDLVVSVRLRQVGPGRLEISVRAPWEEGFRRPATATRFREKPAEPLPRAEVLPAHARPVAQHAFVIDDLGVEHAEGGCALRFPDVLGLGGLLGSFGSLMQPPVDTDARKDVSALGNLLTQATVFIGFTAPSAPDLAMTQVSL